MTAPHSAIPSPASATFPNHQNASSSSSSNQVNNGTSVTGSDLFDFLSFSGLDDGTSPIGINFDLGPALGSSRNGDVGINGIQTQYGLGIDGQGHGSTSTSSGFDMTSQFSIPQYQENHEVSDSNHSQIQNQFHSQDPNQFFQNQSQNQGHQYQQQSMMEDEAGPSNISVHSNHSAQSVSGFSGSAGSIDGNNTSTTTGTKSGSKSRRSSMAQDEEVSTSRSQDTGRGRGRGRGRTKGSTNSTVTTGKRSGSTHSSGQFTVPPTPSRPANSQSQTSTPKANNNSGMDLDQPQLTQQQQYSQSTNTNTNASPHTSFLPTASSNISQVLEGAGQPDNSLLNGLSSLEGMEGIEGLLSMPGFDLTNGGEFDAVQAGLLQQQIHMQSPMIFNNNNNSNNGNSGQNNNPTAYQMAQMFLTSPIPQPNQPTPPTSQTFQQQTAGAAQGHKANRRASINQNLKDAEKQRWAVQNVGGLVTPGPSGEMFPQIRPEMMSPIQLEMFTRAQGMEGDMNNLIPLLSPALTSQTGPSTYTSPANTAAFSTTGQNSNQMNNQQIMSQAAANSTLEALQIQQRHFQEQLLLLQQQQRQLQATAAAVAAASASNATSPYVNAPGSGHTSTSGHSRPGNTPGVHNGTAISTPSPHHFSPLTSPALEATRHYQQHFSPAYPGHQKRPPHPLSALSSPALNPIGSSGGAQQTLSPALLPQNNNDMADPEYLRSLTNLLEQNQNSSQTQGQVQMQQPHLGNDNLPYFPQNQTPAWSSHSGSTVSPHISPINAASTSTGPHRSSLPAKSRPSPMMKPTNHRSHQVHNRHGSTSNVASPTVQTSGRFQSQIPLPGSGMGYLPPAVIDHRGVQAHMANNNNVISGLHGDAHSTPSPVDLTSMMPPPPLPRNTGKGVTPITPASLMNLGNGNGSGSGSSSGGRGNSNPHLTIDTSAINTGSGENGGVPKRQAAVKAAQITKPVGGRKVSGNVQVASSSGPVSGSGSATTGHLGAAGTASTSGRKVKIAPAGKRALAARPPGSVGVRAATKGAAAAAALAPPEGENRRTSHKAAEQKRRDSLKAGFDELRLLLPAINTEALDPESGEPIPGSSAPRLLPKSSLVPDDNPNRGVSKVALLKFSNEYIVRLHEKVDKRDEYIDKLRAEVSRLRLGDDDEIRGDDGEDLLDMDMAEGEEDYNAPPDDDDEEDDEEGGIEEGQGDDDGLGEEGEMDIELEEKGGSITRPRRSKTMTGSVKKSPALNPVAGTINGKRPGMSRGLSGGSAIRGR